jgi:hypothetical protein
LWVLGAAGCRMLGASADPKQDWIHRIRRCTFCSAVCGLLRERRTAEMAMGEALTL